MKTIRIICRDSRLSLIQGEMVRKKILSLHPDLYVQIIPRSSRGDREITVPLSSLDGVDFFTQEIFEALEKGEADLAVHSLKDMSAPHFFSHHAFAIPDRDDVRDIAVFDPIVIDKLKKGETLIIGTCSPRREEMAIAFFKKALPQFGKPIHIDVRSIRGNVEGRLKQVSEGKYDGTILATAGLNRLLVDEQENIQEPMVSSLLKDKLLMLLPLFECVPAPCQGAIVVEADPNNKEAISLLNELNDTRLFEEVYAEKKRAFEYGTGCLQKFGVTTLRSSYGDFLYAAGEDQRGQHFVEWEGLPNLNIHASSIWSSTDHMRSFFTYEPGDIQDPIDQDHVFISNYKAILSSSTISQLASKRIWASGTKTWFELARLGVWVQGSADALGFESFLPVVAMPIFNIQADDVCLLTHKQAAERWRRKGYHAVYNYQLQSTQSVAIEKMLQQAEHVFWSSFAQFEHYGHLVSSSAQHLCASGETARLLASAGIEPIVFPTIKSFEQWRRAHTH